MKLAIGIDPGTKTGVAISNLQTQELEVCAAMRILDAIALVKTRIRRYECYIVVEDARQRKWINDKGKNAKDRRGLAQGAGSVKRDCAIWQELSDSFPDAHWLFQAPKRGKTKITKEYFQRLSGYEGRTSEHARDAYMLVQGINSRNLHLMNWK